jgi:type II secretory pathway pseudopilin PulG
MRLRIRIPARFRDETGMGLIELLIAMVILNVGLFAVVGVFNGATVAMGRAATLSAATAVADRQMEIYRSYQNCAIWLDTTTFPTKGAGSLYEADTKSYMNVYANSGSPNYTPAPTPVTFLDKAAGGTAMSMLPWSTSSTTSVAVVPWNGDIQTSCNPSGASPLTATSTPTLSSTQAIQTINGPDGVLYPVYTYIILLQPSSGATVGSYVKQVTVVVRDPRNTAKILARETSLFNPLLG